MVNRYRLILLIIPILLTLSSCKQNTSNREPSQEEVLAILDARIHKHPNDAKLYHDRANIYLKDNRVNDAISDLMRAVDLDKNGKPIKWMVENSWGNKYGYNGFLIMTNEWFNEYMFRVVIESKYIPEKYLKMFDSKPIMLPAWDPMFAPEE